MNPPNAPFIAEWILRHFVAGPHKDVIAGDLTEHYRQGRSRWWYWCQVVTAMVESSVSEVRSNTQTVLRAITMGMLVLCSWDVIVFPAMMQWLVKHYIVMHRAIPQWFWTHELLYVCTAVLAGWVVGWIARAQRISAVLVFMGTYWLFAFLCAVLGFPHRIFQEYLVISGLVTVAIGWILAQSGYSQRVSGTVVVLVWSFISITEILRFRPILRFGIHFNLGVLPLLISAAITALLALLGSGLWIRPRSGNLDVALLPNGGERP